MKRLALLILTNFSVLVVMAVVLQLSGLGRLLARQGIDSDVLLGFSVAVGFAGSLISLLASKPLAKWSTNARVIGAPASAEERWLVDTVARMSRRAGIAMPEVAIYEGGPNAFSIGAFRNRALIALSTGLLQAMSRDEIEAVLAHEVAHAANGDMVTLALIQGVVNTFVVFLSHLVGYVVDGLVFGSEERRKVGPGFYLTVIVCEILFGLLPTLLVTWLSRRWEFRADRASAAYLGSAHPVISALTRLGELEAGPLPQSIRAMGIGGQPSWTTLFSSHPPTEERVLALRALER